MPTQLITYGIDDETAGTLGDDFIVAMPDLATASETLNGDAGDDYILSDSSYVYLTGTSNSLAAPFDLDQNSAYWTTDENPFFADSTIPHTTLYVLADAAQNHFSSASVGAGETITVDIDFGFGSWIGIDTDVVVELYNSSGTLVASSINGAIAEGDGSVSGRDHFLTFTNSGIAAETYTIRFYENNFLDANTTFEGGESFIANISVTGHAVGPSTAMGADIVNGDGGDDTLAGQGGNDIISGGIGNDTLIGGSGDDTLNGGDGLDIASYASAATAVTINLNAIGPQNFGSSGLDTLISVEGAIGSRFNDLIIGSAANNHLMGGNGVDTVSYGTAATGVTVSLNVGFQDTVGAGSDALSGFENLVGSAFNDTLYGDNLANSLFGGAGDDTLEGGYGDDSLHGGDGSDTASYAGAGAGVIVDLSESGAQYTGTQSGADTLTSIERVIGTFYNDSLVGNDEINLFWGGLGNDSIQGGGGGDFIFGEMGNDTLIGGAGADIIEGGGGDDTVLGGDGDGSLYGDAGNDTLIGGAGADTIHGGADDDSVFGEDGADTVSGDAGNDTVYGGAGDDIANGGEGHDHVLGEDGADQINGDAGDDNVIGGLGGDIIEGGDGQDLLRGGDGDDMLDGGSGTDSIDGGNNIDTASYRSAPAGVTVSLAIAGYQNTIGAGFDTLTFIENLTGSEFNDTLTGNAGINILSGRTGNDILNGGAGDDMLVGGDGNDSLEGGDGSDTASYAVAFAAVNVTLASTAAQNTGGGGVDTLSGIENLLGSGLNDTLTGNSGANTLLGADGDDGLAGGDGNDTLIGGYGSDSLDGGVGVDTASYAGAGGAVTVSLAFSGAQDTGNAGTDTLVFIENLTGSNFNDTLTGNDAANILSGGLGADSMTGGSGNDLYYVDNAGDLVIESSATGGTDQVRSSISHTLGANVENMTLLGSSAVNAFGNGLNNALTGNAAANILSGGLGADSMTGGSGNDLYYVDNAGDTVSETSASGGTDQVRSSISHTLGANFENLTLIGTSAVNGTGNALGNSITGNSRANSLSGGTGNDILNGASGNDTLNGGSGLDLFRFDSALSATGNVDTISGYSVANDTIQLDRTIFTALASPGTLSAAAFRSGTAALDADDRIVYDSATGRIYYDADGNGAGAQVLFAQVTAGLALTNADFGIIA